MGDGVTVMGTKFINFLCYELGKGSMLCKIRDCTARLAEVGTLEATYIAHEMMTSIRYMCNYYLIFFATNVDAVVSEWLVPKLSR